MRAPSGWIVAPCRAWIVVAVASGCTRVPPQASDSDDVVDTDGTADTDTGTADTDSPAPLSFDLLDDAVVYRLLMTGGMLNDLVVRYRLGVQDADGPCPVAQAVEGGTRWSGPCSVAGRTYDGTLTYTREASESASIERWVGSDWSVEDAAGAVRSLHWSGAAEVAAFTHDEDWSRWTDTRFDVELGPGEPPAQSMWPGGAHVIAFDKHHVPKAWPQTHHEIHWTVEYPASSTRVSFDVSLLEEMDGCGIGRTRVVSGVGLLKVDDSTLALDFASDPECTGCYEAALDDVLVDARMCVFVR